MTETIDLTPTPEYYRKMLRIVIENSTNKDDVAWAREELQRVKDVQQWAKEA